MLNSFGQAERLRISTVVGAQGGWGCDPKLAYKSHMGRLDNLTCRIGSGL